MKDYGIKVSKDGYDVKSATGKNLVYTSANKTLSIYMEGMGTADGAGIATITHGLDYVPMFYVYDDNNWKGAGYWGLNQRSYINSTSLNIVTGANKNYSYKIFTNSISGTPTMKPNTTTYGLKISKDGVDVCNSSFDNLALLSTKGTFQIWDKSSVAVDADSDDVWTEGSVAHGLGFVPAYMGLITVYGGVPGAGPGYWYIVGYGITLLSAGFKVVEVDICADTNNYYMRIYPYSDVYAEGAYADTRIWGYGELVTS